MFYVFEVQTTDTAATQVFPFTVREDAEAKYHEILMYAAKSNVRKHGAMIITEDMFIVKSEVYNHTEIETE